MNGRLQRRLQALDHDGVRRRGRFRGQNGEGVAKRQRFRPTATAAAAPRRAVNGRVRIDEGSDELLDERLIRLIKSDRNVLEGILGGAVHQLPVDHPKLVELVVEQA